ncbi:MAG: hypothetical protein NC938_05090 [Candidatus Omnitrophica bacterium]|nr:hypothetical protein [Candidatus Omnitrophota bacterium]MCM8791059.1 hypothetical protein [Candidatus Omnitrophota bacterium]
MENMNVVVIEPVKAMAIKIWSYVPAIAGAIVILVVGWLVAKLVEAIVVRVLKALRLDAASDKAGITNVLAQGDIKLTLSELIGAIVYWLIILVVIATTLDALNLKIASELVSKLVGYVPNILAAIFILILGSFLANFVAAIVRTAASNAGLKNAKMLAQLTQTLIVIFAVVVAIEQLQIATTLLVLAVNIILVSVGLGLALAFGLGCKDIAGKFMQEMINNMKK